MFCKGKVVTISYEYVWEASNQLLLVPSILPVSQSTLAGILYSLQSAIPEGENYLNQSN